MNNAVIALMLLSSSEDEDEFQIPLQRRVLRQKVDIFGLPDHTFVNYFRLNKKSFKYVVGQIEPKLKVGKRSLALTPEIKLATALRFLAQGSYQTSVGNDFNIVLAQPTVSLVLKEVLDALEATICSQWVKAVMTEEEKSEAKEHFYNRTGFPGVIGCVDGTHIKIISPRKSDANMYYNRKGFYSLNAMVVCDHKMIIRFFDARYAGSGHDSLIWNISKMKHILQERYDSGDRKTWLLGDAGYPLQPFLMTPYRSAGERSHESHFNSRHSKARNVVERTIGLLKSRFRCLLGARELNYSPNKATQIANVCVALHNICIHSRTQDVEGVESVVTQEGITNEESAESADSDSAEARRIRDEIRDNLIETI